MYFMAYTGKKSIKFLNTCSERFENWALWCSNMIFITYQTFLAGCMRWIWARVWEPFTTMFAFKWFLSCVNSFMFLIIMMFAFYQILRNVKKEKKNTLLMIEVCKYCTQRKILTKLHNIWCSIVHKKNVKSIFLL